MRKYYQMGNKTPPFTQRQRTDYIIQPLLTPFFVSIGLLGDCLWYERVWMVVRWLNEAREDSKKHCPAKFGVLETVDYIRRDFELEVYIAHVYV